MRFFSGFSIACMVSALAVSGAAHAARKQAPGHVDVKPAGKIAKHAASRGKRVFVPGYTRKDGTYVFPRFRYVATRK